MNERAIFEAALDRKDPEQRVAYLNEACGGDQPLRHHIEGLLKAHEMLGSFLAGPPPAPTATLDEPMTEGPGTIIGPYKLMEQIGEGGMGLVFVAEQQHPVRRKVAVKVIKPGMDTRQVVARFEAERQALAIMDHPNIAKVLDGGETGSGQPYFVMELVKGVPITEFCDQNQVPVRERLELFLDVCQAVQHAHQKGIIHRDIKPSNVLVMSQDGTPLVKVIDFGVAKAIGQQLTDKTVYTQFTQLIGTPLYMSPEQAGQSGLDVDTRSDIYSLGVLLYELLTGTTPFDKDRFKELSYDELRRIIREEEPPKPSTRISTLGMAATTASANRKSDPKQLSRLFRGELDWIVMKALEKDRNRRYESASAFAADLQRYLNDEPVQACPPSAWYRFRKFARRNRVALTIVGMVLCFIMVFGGGVGWFMGDQAARQAKAADAIDADLSQAEALLTGGRWADARGHLQRAEALLPSAAADAAFAARLKQLQAELTVALKLEDARLQGAMVKSGVFDWERKAQAFTEAFQEYGLRLRELEADEIVRRVAASPIREYLLAGLFDWADLQADSAGKRLATALWRMDKHPWRQQARETLRREGPEALVRLSREPQALEQPAAYVLMLAKIVAKTDRKAAVDLLRRAQRRYPNDFWTNLTLGHHLMDSKPARPDDAIGFYRAALALRPDSPGAHVNLGMAFLEKGSLDEAAAAFRKALHFKRDYAEAHNDLGITLAQKGLLDEGLAELREADRLRPGNALFHDNLGSVLKAKGLLDEAIAEYREAIRFNRKFTNAQANLGEVLIRKGLLQEAITTCEKAIHLDENSSTARFYLGRAFQAKGQSDKALAAYQDAVRLQPDYFDAYLNLGAILCDQKRDYEGAVTAFRKAIAVKPGDAAAHLNLGNALRGKGAPADALVAYREAVRLNPGLAEAHNNVGSMLLLEGQFQGAIAEYRAALRLNKDFAEARNNLRHAEEMARLHDRLRDVLEGKDQPKNAAERLGFAQFCKLPYRKQYAAAARFYAEAFAAEPKLGENPRAGRRYHAACAAALAACGQGQDAAAINDKERARLRQQARDWLRADLEALSRWLDEEPAKARPAVAGALQHWLKDPHLAGVRGAEALTRLPAVERQPWQHLWDNVADVLARAQGKIPSQKKSDAN